VKQKLLSRTVLITRGTRRRSSEADGQSLNGPTPGEKEAAGEIDHGCHSV